MKIVHIEDFFHPDAGYQVNLLSKQQVLQGHEVIVITGELHKIPDYLTAFFGKNNIEERDLNFFKITGVKIVRLPLWFWYSGRVFFTPKIFNVIKKIKPDIVFVHGESTLTAIRFLMKSKNLEYPIVTDSHMLKMASKNRFSGLFCKFYRQFITPKILKNNIPVIRVVDSDYVQKFLGIPLTKTILLSFGTDISFFQPNSAMKLKFREDYNIPKNSFVVLYVGKLDEGKGGLLLAKTLKEKYISAKSSEVVFLIVGNTIGAYGEQVSKIFTESENRILRFPTQSYMNLAKFYQMADMMIFPRQCSMSFFEAQSCGLPILFEKNEINIQRTQFNNAICFEPNNSADIRAKLMKFINMPSGELEMMKQASRQYIVQNFDYNPIAQEYTDIMEKEVCKFKKHSV